MANSFNPGQRRNELDLKCREQSCAKEGSRYNHSGVADPVPLGSRCITPRGQDWQHGLISHRE